MADGYRVHGDGLYRGAFRSPNHLELLLVLIAVHPSFPQAIRPKLTLFKTVDEAATAVDEMFANAYQTAGRKSSVFHFSHYLSSRTIPLTDILPQSPPAKAKAMTVVKTVVTRPNAR